MGLKRYVSIDDFAEHNNGFFIYFKDVEGNGFRNKPLYHTFKNKHPLLDHLLTERMTHAHYTAQQIRERHPEDNWKGIHRQNRYLEKTRNHPETLALGYQAYNAMIAIEEEQQLLLPHEREHLPRIAI